MGLCAAAFLLQPHVHATIINEENAGTWGISNDALEISGDDIIREVQLTLHNVRTVGSNSQAALYVQLLDNPAEGMEEIADGQAGNLFEGYGTFLRKIEASELSSTPRDITIRLNHVNDTQAWVWEVFDAPVTVTLGNSSDVQLSSSLLALLDYAGTGNSFGFGLDCDGVSMDAVSLDVTIQSRTQATTPIVLTFQHGDPGSGGTDEPIEVVIDNGQSGTSSTGTWDVSGGSNPYGGNSLWSRAGGTYTWSFAPPEDGSYEVFMWWTEWPSRTTDVPVQITCAQGVINTTVNQQTNGSMWNSLGTYDFDGSGSVRLSAPNAYPTSYCADAVKFVKVADAEPDPEPEPIQIDRIIDNGQSGTSYTGTWSASGGSNPYGRNSLWARNGAAYTWQFDSLPAGTYEILMWWTEWPSRSTAAPIEVSHAGERTDLTINQQNNGGQWNSIGQFYCDGSVSITLSAPDRYTTSYNADAVRIISVP